MSINSTYIGPKVYKYDLHWVIWSLRVRYRVMNGLGLGFGIVGQCKIFSIRGTI